jgi:hypothetical protein
MHLAVILRFEFIIALVVTEYILSNTVALTIFLSKVTIKRIQDERNDPAVWDSIFDCAVKLAAEFDIPPSVPRRIRPSAIQG